MLYEWTYLTSTYPLDFSREDNWVLSFGDTSGYGMHADFANGWDVGYHQNMLDLCTDGTAWNWQDGQCPTIKLWTEGGHTKPCMPQGHFPDEDVGRTWNWLPSLPGCNPLWKDNSTKPTCAKAVPDPPVTKTIAPDSLNEEWYYYSCPMKAQPGGDILFALGDVHPIENMTAEMCLDMCAERNATWAMMS